MKKVAIMQPYFMPYLGYFSLIKNTDEFIMLDTVQFIRHGWIERNRVLKQPVDWLYIKVPLLKHDQKAQIKELRIDNSQPWQDKIFAQLQPYQKIAPQYGTIITLLKKILSAQYEDIVTLNKTAAEEVCSYLGFEPKIEVFSKMGLEIEQPTAPDEWALNICKALGGVSEYWNPPGGQSFFDREKYAANGIDIKFLEVNMKPYDQKREPFEPGLSIIDVLMFNSPQEVNIMLEEYELS